MDAPLKEKHFINCMGFFFRKECDLDVTVLMKFCSEGDNAIDAMQLVQYYDQWMKQV